MPTTTTSSSSSSSSSATCFLLQETVDLRLALAPLLSHFEGTNALRLVARPGSVTIDRSENSAPDPVAVVWEAAQHDTARQLLGGEIARLSSGVTATMVGDALVLRAPPVLSRRTDDLVRGGWLSPLAARTLSASVSLGRNVLVAGPWCAAVELISALLAEGARPCVVGQPGDAVPSAWPMFGDAREVGLYGADRIGSWSLSAARVGETMGGRNGVIAWLDAPRLDRALTRFEAGLASPEGGSCPCPGVGASSGGALPLHVLAALDLVVVLSSFGAPRVNEIAEIMLVEDGYRPRLLFRSGLPPVPTALVPVGLPSFVAELTRAGMDLLVNELRHAQPRSSDVAPIAPPPSAPAAPSPESLVARGAARSVASVLSRRAATDEFAFGKSASQPVSQPLVSGASSGGVEASSRGDSTISREPVGPTAETAPGWELDQIDEEGSSDPAMGQDGAASHDEAVLAATYGLAPPPRPAGARATVAENRSFQEALRRAGIRAESPEASSADVSSADAQGTDGVSDSTNEPGAGNANA